MAGISTILARVKRKRKSIKEKRTKGPVNLAMKNAKNMQVSTTGVLPESAFYSRNYQVNPIRKRKIYISREGKTTPILCTDKENVCVHGGGKCLVSNPAVFL